MTAFDWILLTGAGFMGLVGLALLFLSWKRPGTPVLLGSGWTLIAASAVISLIANGDRGLAQLSVVIIAAATVFFGIQLAGGIASPVGANRQRSRGAEPSIQRPVTATLSGIWTFLITGPVAGAIALFASAVLFKLIRPADGSPATAGIIAIMSAVFVWAILSVLLLIEPRAGRRSAYAGAALVVTAAAAFI